MRLLLLCCCAALVGAAEPEVGDIVRVQTHDGRDLHGRLLSLPDADPLRIRVTTGSLRAEVRIAQPDVLRLAGELAPDQARLTAIREASRRAGPGSSAAQHWAWAEECLQLGDRIAWREQLRLVIVREPDHRAAREALGHVLHEGLWMTPTEAKQAQGLVFHDGSWLPAAEVARMQAEEQARRDAAALARREAREERARERAERAEQAAALGLQDRYRAQLDAIDTWRGPRYPWFIPALPGNGINPPIWIDRSGGRLDGFGYHEASWGGSLNLGDGTGISSGGWSRSSSGVPFLSSALRAFGFPF